MLSFINGMIFVLLLCYLLLNVHAANSISTGVSFIAPSVVMGGNGPILSFTVKVPYRYNVTNTNFDSMFIGNYNDLTAALYSSVPNRCGSADYSLTPLNRPEYTTNETLFKAFLMSQCNDATVSGTSGTGLNWNTATALGLQGFLLYGNNTMKSSDSAFIIQRCSKTSDQSFLLFRISIDLALYQSRCAGIGSFAITNVFSTQLGVTIWNFVGSWTQKIRDPTTTNTVRLLSTPIHYKIYADSNSLLYLLDDTTNMNTVSSVVPQPITLVGVNIIQVGSSPSSTQWSLQMFYLLSYFLPADSLTQKIGPVTSQSITIASNCYGDYVNQLSALSTYCTNGICRYILNINTAPRTCTDPTNCFKTCSGTSVSSALDGKHSFTVNPEMCLSPSEVETSNTAWLAGCYRPYVGVYVDTSIPYVSYITPAFNDDSVQTPVPSLLVQVGSLYSLLYNTLIYPNKTTTSIPSTELTSTTTPSLFQNDILTFNIRLTDTVLEQLDYINIVNFSINTIRSATDSTITGRFYQSQLVSLLTYYPRLLTTYLSCGQQVCTSVPRCNGRKGCDGIGIAIDKLKTLLPTMSVFTITGTIQILTPGTVSFENMRGAAFFDDNTAVVKHTHHFDFMIDLGNVLEQKRMISLDTIVNGTEIVNGRTQNSRSMGVFIGCWTLLIILWSVLWLTVLRQKRVEKEEEKTDD